MNGDTKNSSIFTNTYYKAGVNFNALISGIPSSYLKICFVMDNLFIVDSYRLYNITLGLIGAELWVKARAWK